MPSVLERIMPELLHFEPGDQRRRMLRQSIRIPETTVVAKATAFILVAVYFFWPNWPGLVGLPVWASVPIGMLSGLVAVGFAVWHTRRKVRRYLRRQLARNGVSICIPCGYNLTGNESGVCPECGSEAKSR